MKTSLSPEYLLAEFVFLVCLFALLKYKPNSDRSYSECLFITVEQSVKYIIGSLVLLFIICSYTYDGDPKKVSERERTVLQPVVDNVLEPILWPAYQLQGLIEE